VVRGPALLGILGGCIWAERNGGASGGCAAGVHGTLGTCGCEQGFKWAWGRVWDDASGIGPGAVRERKREK